MEGLKDKPSLNIINLKAVGKGNDMSRNAYRVKRIVTAKSPSFNLSYDEELKSILVSCHTCKVVI